jgi:heat shock protein HtpX
MGFAKRIILFLLVNVLVMVTVTTTLSLLGVKGYLTQYGIDYQNLAVFCLVWGMAGSFISLGLSRIMAKMMMGVQVIDPNTRDPELQDLVQMVHNLSRSAGLPAMPEVGVYDSPELNAFATGPTRSRALVAVSTGLMSRMKRDELEGVLGHEIAHVANGDMVTLTLVQGIINAFVMFLSRVLAFAITQAMRSKDDEGRESSGGGMLQFILVPIFEIIFSILGMIVVAWFSRFREFRADSGGARLAGRDKMIAALEALKRTYETEIEGPQTPSSIRAFQISPAGRKGGFLHLFSTHPPLDDRIAALQYSTKY